jgi:hypothetical protein
MDARTAVAESLAQELDQDMSPEFMAASDKFLMQLYLRGYIVTLAPDGNTNEQKMRSET